MAVKDGKLLGGPMCRLWNAYRTKFKGQPKGSKTSALPRRNGRALRGRSCLRKSILRHALTTWQWRTARRVARCCRQHFTQLSIIYYYILLYLCIYIYIYLSIYIYIIFIILFKGASTHRPRIFVLVCGFQVQHLCGQQMCWLGLQEHPLCLGAVTTKSSPPSDAEKRKGKHPQNGSPNGRIW